MRRDDAIRSGADDGSRTRTGITRGILSPLRLPVSPRPLNLREVYYILLGGLLMSASGKSAQCPQLT
jgi:hypothetical protein